ncbi:ATP-binding protein [Oceanobacillus massiliensis]|uniref:ATP-binding protein n=1 Tax=Oceanobacillus massiliensis TaxID=1465765 RepID=UPI0002884695|nr:AAA family ATPase [Oceanobacillus massiliensis]
MKIRSATINGFGKWVDYNVDFSPESAICIYGENESGKTTIQKFILFMLFGLPPKQRNFYRPKTSGKMGGRMTLDDPEIGVFNIERFDEVQNGAAICFTRDGNVHDEAWLQKRLNGMTVKTYESIFSFSALDLADIRTMKDEDLGEILLGIGLTGSASIYSIEKRLETRIGELFKPKGNKPAINQQINELKTISASLQSFRETEASYRDKTESIELYDRQLTALQSNLKDEKAKMFAIDKQLQALPLIQEYHQIENRLAGYPEQISFPESGLERLEKWKELLLPLQSEWNILAENETKYNGKLEAAEHRLLSKETQLEAETLLNNKATIDMQLQELNRIRNTIDHEQLQLNEEADRLNIGLQLTELDRIELPFYLEKTWNKLRNEHEQLKLEKEQISNEESQLKQQRNYILNQMKEIEGGLLTDAQVRELNDRVNAFNEYSLLQKMKRESDQGKKTWVKKKAARKKVSSTVLAGSIIAAICSGGAAIIAGIGWLYAVMMLFIAAGMAQWLLTKHSVDEMDELLQTDSNPLPIDVTEAEKMEAENLLEMHRTNKNEQAAFQEQEKLSGIHFIQWKEKKRQLDEKERILEQQIHQQYDAYPFLKRVDIAYWPEFYHSMKQILKMNNDRQKHIREAAEIEGQLASFRLKAEEFIERSASQQNAADLDMDAMLDIIANMVKLQSERLQERSNYREQLNEMEEKREELKQKITAYEMEVRHLYTIAEAETEDLFYYRAKQFNEKRELQLELKKTVDQLLKILPEDSMKEALEKAETEENLLMRQEYTVKAIEDLEHELEKVREELASLRANLAAMESSDSYSQSLHQYEMATDQLQKTAREWSILKTAKEMLSKTKKDYRDKYLTRVIETTEKYFTEITGNVYQHVYPPTESNPFQVESYENLRYTVKELSQGTIDQLYVSLRLAISEIMSKEHGLPFIMDDAFVHFDAVRISRMMNILGHAAEKQQVILFTCKKEIADAASGMDRIDLHDIMRV